MEAFLWTAAGALALGGVAALLWDNAHGMHPGEEPAETGDVTGDVIGDVATVPADQLHHRRLAHFERMIGVL